MGDAGGRGVAEVMRNALRSSWVNLYADYKSNGMECVMGCLNTLDDN
jgi:hypothetical protein